MTDADRLRVFEAKAEIQRLQDARIRVEVKRQEAQRDVDDCDRKLLEALNVLVGLALVPPPSPTDEKSQDTEAKG